MSTSASSLRSGTEHPGSRPRSYLQWFLRFGLIGFIYSVVAWTCLLGSSGKDRVSFAVLLPMHAVRYLVGWLEPFDPYLSVFALSPPGMAFLCGLLGVCACAFWHGLRLEWQLAKNIVFLVLTLLAILIVGCAVLADSTNPGPRGTLTLGGYGGVLLGIALLIIIAGCVALAMQSTGAPSKVMLDSLRGELHDRHTGSRMERSTSRPS